jgi:secretion/DNA translocation related TadE-like protein
VWLVGMLAAVALAVSAGALRGAATLARHRVEAAADLAALAASARAAAGLGDGCAVAARIAAANGARLADCRLAGALAEVTAEKTLTAGRLGTYRVAARARASPAGQGSVGVTGASARPEPSSDR